jgi:hypothetical protein
MVSLSAICVDDIMLSASQVSGAIMHPSISHLAVIIAFFPSRFSHPVQSIVIHPSEHCHSLRVKSCLFPHKRTSTSIIQAEKNPPHHINIDENSILCKKNSHLERPNPLICLLARLIRYLSPKTPKSEKAFACLKKCRDSRYHAE